MALSPRFHPDTADNLKAIFTWIAGESLAGARRLEAEVDKTLRPIGDHPYSSRQHGRLRDVRRIVAGKRITLIYAVRQDEVFIFDVAYAGRDIRKLRRRPPP